MSRGWDGIGRTKIKVRKSRFLINAFDSSGDRSSNIIRGSAQLLGRRDRTVLQFHIVGLGSKIETAVFDRIEVAPPIQGRGIGVRMVEAVMHAYPDSIWQNDSLDERTGPWFAELSRMFPGRMHEVVYSDRFSHWASSAQWATLEEAHARGYRSVW